MTSTAPRPHETAPSTNSLRKAETTTTTGSSLVSAKIFECFTLPPTNSFRGAFIPRALNKRRNRRKVSIEIHKVPRNPGIAGPDQFTEECILRVLDPAGTEEKRLSLQQFKLRRAQAKHDTHTSSFAVVQSTDDGDDEDYEDDVSTVGVAAEFLETNSPRRYTLANYDKGWVAKYRFPIRAVESNGVNQTSVFIHISAGKLQQDRELVFDTKADAEDFDLTIRNERLKQIARAEEKMNAVLGSARPDITDQLTFLVEIVSAWDIPIGDIVSTDPYVVCMMGKEKIHRTKFLSKTLNPVWTVTTDSLFLLRVDIQTLFLHDGIICILRDFDKFGKNDVLGTVRVCAKHIYDGKGERLEYKLEPPSGKTTEVPGYMAIRCRRASEEDIKFVEEYYSSNQQIKKLEIAQGVGGASNLKSIMTKRTRIAKDGPNAGKKQYKMRPHPDPSRPEATLWMTHDEIEGETLKESRNWVDAGSGAHGRIFVEILGCDKLPNMDVGGFAGNKTDAFVSLVFEDIYVRTDVIDDCLSPRWPPWSQRAFVFHILHSSSQLFLGVFDYDAGLTPGDDHDHIGRISVDLSNLRRNTTYVLKYDLCTSSSLSQRKNNGTITFRLRLDIPDERALLLSTLEIPPEVYVNTKTRKEFRVAKITCAGQYDMEKYSMKTINYYIEELLSLQNILLYIEDGILGILLWRGTLPISGTGDGTIYLPIHSITAFFVAIYLVENPNLFPSFFFASLAWIMLAANGYRRYTPDIWSRCKGFDDFLMVLMLGESQLPPHSIKPYENHEKAQAFLEDWKKRLADSEAAAAKSIKEAEKRQQEYERELAEIGEEHVDISTKGSSLSVDPFKPILFPLQQTLAIVCRYIRHVKFIILWEECYISFWITAGFFLLSLIFFFIPWFFIIKWSARLIVWTIFGPWMKLVDLFYFSKIKPLTEEEIEEKKRQEREARMAQVSVQAAAARVKRENAFKLKAMKQYLFGRFITRVPVLKEDRYRDLPLPESYAEPYKPDPRSLSELAMEDAGYKKVRVPGHHLVGDMIPRIESPGLTEAPTGQPTAYLSLVNTDDLGPGIAKPSIDSTFTAYAKIGTLVTAAAVLTWFGVPLLSGTAHYFLSPK